MGGALLAARPPSKPAVLRAPSEHARNRRSELCIVSVEHRDARARARELETSHIWGAGHWGHPTTSHGVLGGARAQASVPFRRSCRAMGPGARASPRPPISNKRTSRGMLGRAFQRRNRVKIAGGRAAGDGERCGGTFHPVRSFARADQRPFLTLHLSSEPHSVNRGVSNGSFFASPPRLIPPCEVEMQTTTIPINHRDRTRCQRWGLRRHRQSSSARAPESR